MLKKISALFFLFFTIFFLFPQLALANEEFKIDSTITYQALPDVTLKVTQEVIITNKLSNVYARQYSFVIEGEAPTGIYAWDEFGEIKYQQKSDPTASTISLPFNQEVVGKDKILRFGLNYFKNDLIKKSGDVWEIIMPKFGSAQEVDSLNVVLEVPTSFGPVAFITPEPGQQSQVGEKYLFMFSKEQISRSGVVAAFGEFQTFDFRLTYHLENKEAVNVSTEIALPPDTSYQKVYYQSVSPNPENVEVDGDGNWLAQYQLRPKQKIAVKITGQAKVFARPFQKFDPPPDLSLFLEPTSRWQTKDSQLAQTAQNLKTPQQIYDFVVDKLSYDYSRVREGVERLGAKQALNQPERATCMEFTDLFVALARASGIPAREINGYAFTDNPQLRPLSLVQDVLHAWPEYWDEETQTWIQVDPTWEATTGGVDYFNKLDLGHFAFVIHGRKGDYPPPAGAYKIEGEYEKDVEINYGSFQKSGEEKIDVSFSLPSTMTSETKTSGSITVKNLSPTAIYNFSFDLKVEGAKAEIISDNQIKVFPPFSHRTIPLKLSSLGFLKTGSAQITITANNQVFKHSMMIESLLLKVIVVLLGIVFVSLTLAYFVYRLRKRRRAKIDTHVGVC